MTILIKTPMPTINACDLRTVRRFTNAGILQCKVSLVEHNGDTYLAIRDLLTRDEILEMHQSVRIRNIAPKSMKDPPTREELQLVERLYREVVLRIDDEAQDQQAWWRRWIMKLVRGSKYKKTLGPGKPRVCGPVKLRLISNYGSSERVVTENATTDVIQGTMDSLDWHAFHQVVLERPDDDWLEVGGSLNPPDGLCIVYEENRKQHVCKVSPTTVDEMTRILLQYLEGAADWERIWDWWE